MDIPESTSSAILPKNLVYPFGIVNLYSNQKSNRSPTRKISVASFGVHNLRGLAFIKLTVARNELLRPGRQYKLFECMFVEVAQQRVKGLPPTLLRCF